MMLQKTVDVLEKNFLKIRVFKIRTYVIICACIYISISHIVLPAFQANHFFVFAKWNLFVYPPNKMSYDLTWDNGKTFLFRDHRHKASMFQTGNFLYLWSLINSNKHNLSEAKKYYLNKLYKICNCEKIERVTIEGSHYNYLFSKNPPKIIKKEIL